MIRPGKIDPTILYEGRIEKKWAVMLLSVVALAFGVLILSSSLSKAQSFLSFFSLDTVPIFAFLIGCMAFGIYSLWMAGHEKVLFEDAQITYVSGKKKVSYTYREIHTVFILKGTNRRGPIRHYLIIPVGESTASKRRQLENTVSNTIGRGENRRMKQGDHLFCAINNENEKELIVAFLRNRANVIWE